MDNKMTYSVYAQQLFSNLNIYENFPTTKLNKLKTKRKERVILNYHCSSRDNMGTVVVVIVY